MSAWTTAADLREQVLRMWDKGRLLASRVAVDAAGRAESAGGTEAGDGAEVPAAGAFPLRLVLRTPRSADLSARFDAVRGWSAELQQGARNGLRLVLREVRHRVIGLNSLPDEAWVDTLDDALRLAGKTREAQVFDRLLADTRDREPALLPWLARQPLRALALADDWPRLLDVVGWLRAHPRPGIYLRQVDLAGVHSKFIEAQRAVLSELLDLALPAPDIDATASGVTQFARRYGFRDKPARVRLRFLDPMQASGWRGSGDDCTVLQSAFVTWAPPVSRVFVTENEINFLAFPAVADSLLVFGAGYGLAAVAQAGWLSSRDIHYWGDIDTHGFAILDQLRARHLHARSLLMNHETLLAHREHWSDEPQPTLRELPHLDEAERRLYDDLRWQRLADRPLRLEQERVAFRLVNAAVAAAAALCR